MYFTIEPTELCVFWVQAAPYDSNIYIFSQIFFSHITSQWMKGYRLQSDYFLKGD